MTAREYLEQYGEAVRVTAQLKREYQRELDLIDSVRSTLGGDGMPHGSGVSRKVEAQAIRLAEKALEWKEAELEAIRIRQKVYDLIVKVPGEQGTVLYEKYINLKSWDEIAQVVSYSKRHTRRIHDEALAFIEDVLLCHSNL